MLKHAQNITKKPLFDSVKNFVSELLKKRFLCWIWTRTLLYKKFPGRRPNHYATSDAHKADDFVFLTNTSLDIPKIQ